MKNYLIIDIGTSSIRASIMNEKAEQIRTEVFKRVSGIEFDAEQEWEILFGMLKKLTQGCRHIDSIAVSALLGWVGIDENCKAVTPGYSYMHKCPEEHQQFLLNENPDCVYEICRRRSSAENAVFKMIHLRDSEPEVYAKIKVFTSYKDFINAKLTGIFRLDHTTAAYTLLYNLQEAGWSREMTDMTGADLSILPELARPYEQLGKVTGEIARALGIEEDTPVAVGSVDGSTAVLGAGATSAGLAVSVMGTTEVFFITHKELNDEKSHSLVTNPHVFPGLWISGGPMGMYGGTIDWYLKHIMNESKSIGEMNELAAKVPEGSEGVLFFPTLAGERTPYWNEGFRGTVIGMDRNTEPEHLFRAIMESNGYALRDLTAMAEVSEATYEKVIAIGGGSNSSLWLQIKADIMGKKIVKSEVEEATGIGSLFLAMLADGVDELPQIPYVKEYTPDQAKQEIYAGLIKDYLVKHDILARLYQ